MTIEAGITALAQAVGADIKTLTNRGPIPVGSLYLTSSYTLTLADHLKFIIVNSATAVTLTVPIGLPDGFSFWVQQNGVGNVAINPATRSGGMNSNAARVGPNFQFDSCFCACAIGNTVVNAIFGVTLPTLQLSNTASQSRNTTTMTDLAGISFPLLAGAMYDVDLKVQFSTNNAAAALRLGLSALPSGASCQMEGRVWNTNVAGASPYTNALLLTPSSIIAAGTASVSGAQQLGTIKGRIYMGGNSGTITAQASSINTTGLVAIAVGAANMVLTQVY